MKQARLVVALSLFAVIAMWAVPSSGAAPFHLQRRGQQRMEKQTSGSGLPVMFKGTRDRGPVVDLWLEGRGPYAFILDTGAGVSIVSSRVAGNLNLSVRNSKQPLEGGLTTTPISSTRETTLRQLEIGRRGASLTAIVDAAVADNLPPGVDGILDPIDVSPFGYSIDLQTHELIIFDETHVRLRENDASPDGTVVRWLRGDGSTRPFIRLGDGRLAIIDTGSSFGLAVSDGVMAGSNHRNNNRRVSDLGGGHVQATRVAPTTVVIGSLVLRGVPTDFLSGSASDTPVIIGRDALYPFKLTFDPVSKLISIEPSGR